MTRQKFTIGAVAAAFTLSLAPAWAGQAGSRPNTTGSSTGSAVSRGGEGGGSSSGSSGSSSSGSMGSSGGSSSGSSGSSSGGSYGGSRSAPRERAPERPGASPRGSGYSDQRAVGRAPGTAASAGSDAPVRTREAVPSYSRPREGHNVLGTAVQRPPYSGGGGGGWVVPCGAYCYDWYYPGYGYGYYPYYGYGFGLGFGYWGDPYWGGGGGYYTSPSYGAGGYSSQYRDQGNLRLKVKPRDAQVYIDGYYVGVVDSFDGAFQKLGIEAGSHKIELRAEGYETAQFEVFVTPGETVTYKGEMKPIVK